MGYRLSRRQLTLLLLTSVCGRISPFNLAFGDIQVVKGMASDTCRGQSEDKSKGMMIYSARFGIRTIHGLSLTPLSGLY